MAERARTEALRELGVAHAQLVADHDLVFVVRHAEVDYRSPARLDDPLVVQTRLASLGSASLRLGQAFFNELQLARNAATPPLVVVRVSLVCVGRPGSNQPGSSQADEPLRPARIPERWRAALALLQQHDADETADIRGPRP
jgi:acyl-CoA thioester hydrolase